MKFHGLIQFKGTNVVTHGYETKSSVYMDLDLPYMARNMNRNAINIPLMLKESTYWDLLEQNYYKPYYKSRKKQRLPL